MREIAHAQKRNPVSDLGEILQDGRHLRRNDVGKFWWRSVKGFRGCGVKFWLFPLTMIVVLTTLSHYRASVWCLRERILWREFDVVCTRTIYFCLSNAILTDYLITLVSVCVSVRRSVVERLRPQFFTDFHQILHAARKFDCFEGYCFWDKPKVDYQF